MFEIIEATFLTTDVKLFKVVAPAIARNRQAGQFVIVRVHEFGERIPLTIADSDDQKKTITIIVQGVGKTSKLLNTLELGDKICDVVGPLGKPAQIRYFGTAVVMGGGLGAAIAYPIAKALKQAGNRVISIVGARSKDHVILENKIKAISDETYITTDDGSYGLKGFVTDNLRALIQAGRQIDFVLAVGPVPMMRATAEVTRPHNIKTMASLNPIMVDGTGMCGGCRVLVNGKSRFACVDGPEFDAHQIDFDTLAARNAMYHDKEKMALDRFLNQVTELAEHNPDECRLVKQHGTLSSNLVNVE